MNASNFQPERFTRIRHLIGQNALDRLHQSHVTVVGLGAVGGYAVEALARSGVGHLRLVDFDRIQPTNFNRQIFALESNLNRLKTDVAAERVRQINPACDVEPLELFVHNDTLDQVLAGPPDMVIDAIDGLNPKVQLLAAVQTRGINVVSSMGAALRTNPAHIKTGPLSQTVNCPLARLIRKRLRRLKIDLNIPCVYSTELVAELPDQAIGQEQDTEDIMKRGRIRRPLGSLPTITGMFGLCVANEVINRLIDNVRHNSCRMANDS